MTLSSKAALFAYHSSCSTRPNSPGRYLSLLLCPLPSLHSTLVIGTREEPFVGHEPPSEKQEPVNNHHSSVSVSTKEMCGFDAPFMAAAPPDWPLLLQQEQDQERPSCTQAAPVTEVATPTWDCSDFFPVESPDSGLLQEVINGFYPRPKKTSSGDGFFHLKNDHENVRMDVDHRSSTAPSTQAPMQAFDPFGYYPSPEKLPMVSEGLLEDIIQYPDFFQFFSAKLHNTT
ncbi:hypothetical protein J5N97_007370 [Dioscorea zingiberensis]|uniref:Uncharacterized protein n=1 Tax=Dioscorea zingiberensis TaxID=325984 RepID=A0A9D5HU64_9LILI|nr:hypothetical protein J5N97_007370 [Dioscorea zingiberensis]